MAGITHISLLELASFWTVQGCPEHKLYSRHPEIVLTSDDVSDIVHHDNQRTHFQIATDFYCCPQTLVAVNKASSNE